MSISDSFKTMRSQGWNPHAAHYLATKAQKGGNDQEARRDVQNNSGRLGQLEQDYQNSKNSGSYFWNQRGQGAPSSEAFEKTLNHFGLNDGRALQQFNDMALNHLKKLEKQGTPQGYIDNEATNALLNAHLAQVYQATPPSPKQSSGGGELNFQKLDTYSAIRKSG